MRPSKTALTVAFAVLSLIWGSSYAFIKIGLDAGWPPLLYAGARNSLASLALWAWLAAARRRLPRTWAQWWPGIGFGVINGLGFGLVFWGTQYIPSGRASVLNATVPFFVLALGRLWLHEAIAPRKFAGVLLGFAGVLVTFADRLTGAGAAADPSLQLVGQGALVVGSVFYGTSQVWSKRYFHGGPVENSAVQLLVSGGMLTLLGLVKGEGYHAGMLAPRPLFALLWMGLMGSAIAFVLLFYLIEHLGSVQGSYVTVVSPIVAVALGAVLLGESITASLLTGTTLVLGGVVLVVIPSAASLRPRRSP